MRQSGNAVPRRNWWKLTKTMFPGKKNVFVTLAALSKHLRKQPKVGRVYLELSEVHRGGAVGIEEGS